MQAYPVPECVPVQLVTVEQSIVFGFPHVPFTNEHSNGLQNISSIPVQVKSTQELVEFFHVQLLP
jgi:hypothetical protein